MDMFEKVEKLRAKANVSYEDAKAALEEANGDILDAMILLEKQGKTSKQGKESYSTKAEDQTQYLAVVEQPKKEKNAGNNKFIEKVKELWHKSCHNFFVVERNGERIIKLPLWAFIVFVVCAWHVMLIAMVVSLFFGCHYSFEGEDNMKTANEVAGKVESAAEKAKEEFKNL